MRYIDKTIIISLTAKLYFVLYINREKKLSFFGRDNIYVIANADVINDVIETIPIFIEKLRISNKYIIP